MNNPMDMMNMVNMLRQNPMQFLAQRGFNVPGNLAADPNQIIQHLMNTGQVSQDQYNRAQQMARNFHP